MANNDAADAAHHSDALFVVDPTGHIAAELPGPFTIEKLESDFHAMIAGS
jgi:hypothetical protein